MTVLCRLYIEEAYHAVRPNHSEKWALNADESYLDFFQSNHEHGQTAARCKANQIDSMEIVKAAISFRDCLDVVGHQPSYDCLVAAHRAIRSDPAFRTHAITDLALIELIMEHFEDAQGFRNYTSLDPVDIAIDSPPDNVYHVGVKDTRAIDSIEAT